MTAAYRPLVRLLAAGFMTFLLTVPLFAQTMAVPGNVVLVADHVYIAGDQRLTARGHVEALMNDVRLLATEIVYDASNDRITLSGPIRIIQGDDITILASWAELDSSFQTGLLRSARLVFNQQLQMAANQIDRREGRYNILSKTSVTSCRVCSAGEVPLWQIRARRVVHDEDEQMIYFDHASLRIKDLPIAYFPHLRIPDPRRKRARGFLVPTIRTTSQLSYGLKLPYFFTMGPHRDLTLTPYISSETNTLEFRYRQAFRKGRLNVLGAVSDDSIRPGETRGYAFVSGAFDLPRDYKLSFDLWGVTDESYLDDYDYSDEDRLVSGINLRRARRNENTRFALLNYKSLRPGEDNGTLPTLVAVAENERRYFPAALGGELRTTLALHGHHRWSSGDVTGRDVGRVDAALLWRRNWTSGRGLRYGVTSELAFDAFRTNDDSTVSGFDSQLTPAVAAYLRYPMSRRTANGAATLLLEPVAQIGWTGQKNLDVANDESTRVEFDEGNLLALSRFPSYDRRERGLTAAIGLNWVRRSDTSWQGSLTFGQVFHEDAQPDLSEGSGLSGRVSDLLVAGQLKTINGLNLTARTLIDPGSGLRKASARAGWTNKKLWMDASYVWLGADPAEDRPTKLAEFAVDSRYRLGRHWTGLFDWRYDFGNNRTAEAGVGMEYRNECVRMELSVSRRFSTSATVRTSTDLGFTIALLGFSLKSNDNSYTRRCGDT